MIIYRGRFYKYLIITVVVQYLVFKSLFHDLPLRLIYRYWVISSTRLFLRMKSPIRTDYRISKKNGKPIFDLKDMLMIVESLEEEALANEHRGKS